MVVFKSRPKAAALRGASGGVDMLCGKLRTDGKQGLRLRRGAAYTRGPCGCHVRWMGGFRDCPWWTFIGANYSHRGPWDARGEEARTSNREIIRVSEADGRCRYSRSHGYTLRRQHALTAPAGLNSPWLRCHARKYPDVGRRP